MNNNLKLSIEKEFVPYTESLELKELGVEEPCLGWYQESNYGTEKVHIDSHWKTHLSGLEDEDFLPAPTFSQAFRFFREKYKLGAIVSQFGYGIENEYGQIIHDIEDGVNPSCYEEAEIACLKKLIEIVKEKQHEVQTN